MAFPSAAPSVSAPVAQPGATALASAPGLAGTTFAQRALCAAAATLAGLTLLAAVGFSQPHAVHEAAHDTRHAAGFPCH